MIDFSLDCAEPAEKENERCRLGSLSVSLIRALGHLARQIAIPKTVKDFHQICGYFVGNLGRWRSAREILSIASLRLKFGQYLQAIELTLVFPSINQFLRLLGQRRYRRRISFIIIAI